LVFKKKCFKAILGDASFNNIDKNKIIPLFNILKKISTDDAVLIFRHCNFFDKYTPNKLIQMYFNNKITIKEMATSYYFNKNSGFVYNNRIFSKEGFTKIVSTLKNAGAKKQDLDYIKSHAGEYYHTILEEKEFESILKKYFSKFKAYSTKDILYTRAAPIYFIKLKK
jgi:hypothetical protein